MKKLMLLAAALGLMGCEEFNPTLLPVSKNWVYEDSVSLMGRSWKIGRGVDDASLVRAERDNNNYNPYGGPSVRKSIQASRAIKQATGCKILKGTFYKDDSDVFFAKVLCKHKAQS